MERANRRLRGTPHRSATASAAKRGSEAMSKMKGPSSTQPVGVAKAAKLGPTPRWSALPMAAIGARATRIPG